MPHPFAQERIWFDKSRVEEAETLFYQHKYGVSGGKAAVSTPATLGSLAAEISKVRESINKALAQDPSDAALSSADMKRIEKLETENRELRGLISKLEARIASLELTFGGSKQPTTTDHATHSAPAKEPVHADPAKEEADDDIDLFGSDEEVDEEAERIKAERLKEYAEKKSKKPALIAKSTILLDVKPWDDETDMAELEKCVRSIEMDGLLWGASKLLPVGYGIKKLQIGCVVEDAKVGTDDLEEKITSFEDFVQSVDIAAFNKI